MRQNHQPWYQPTDHCPFSQTNFLFPFKYRKTGLRIAGQNDFWKSIPEDLSSPGTWRAAGCGSAWRACALEGLASSKQFSWLSVSPNRSACPYPWSRILSMRFWERYGSPRPHRSFRRPWHSTPSDTNHQQRAHQVSSSNFYPCHPSCRHWDWDRHCRFPSQTTPPANPRPTWASEHSIRPTGRARAEPCRHCFGGLWVRHFDWDWPHSRKAIRISERKKRRLPCFYSELKVPQIDPFSSMPGMCLRPLFLSLKLAWPLEQQKRAEYS